MAPIYTTQQRHKSWEKDGYRSHIEGLAEGCDNSNGFAIELPKSCAKTQISDQINDDDARNLTQNKHTSFLEI